MDPRKLNVRQLEDLADRISRLEDRDGWKPSDRTKGQQDVFDALEEALEDENTRILVDIECHGDDGHWD